MARSYRHLTYEERCQIEILKTTGNSPVRISEALGIHRSTVTRELKRNGPGYSYDSRQAQRKAQNRRHRFFAYKMSIGMIAMIEEKLKLNWSPEQISGRLKKQGQGHVSHETIYKHIWADKKRGGPLYKYLRHSEKKYNKRSKGTSKRGCIPGRVDIKERPLIVEEKIRLGDWELDTIIGAQHRGAIVSMVDRTSKFTRLVKVPNKTAEEVEKAQYFIAKFLSKGDDNLAIVENYMLEPQGPFVELKNVKVSYLLLRVRTFHFLIRHISALNLILSSGSNEFVMLPYVSIVVA